MSLNGCEINAGGEAAPAVFPSAEEIRMVRSIAVLALIEASRTGSYTASFHGFRIQAVRHGPTSGFASSAVLTLSVSLGDVLVARFWIPANYAQAMEPNP
jgi:hypothetical protein